MARRTGQRISDRLAVEILDLVDRRIGGTYQYRSGAPIISLPMMRIGAPLAKVPTAADTPAAVAISMLPPITAWIDSGRLDVEDFEIEPVLLEDAAALAELGDAGVPGAALRNRNLQRLLRPGVAAGAGGHASVHSGRDNFALVIGFLPVAARHCCRGSDHMSRYGGPSSDRPSPDLHSTAGSPPVNDGPAAPRGSSMLHRKIKPNVADLLEDEFAQEKASALGRLGRALEATLAALARFDASHGTEALSAAQRQLRAVAGRRGKFRALAFRSAARGLRAARHALRPPRLRRAAGGRCPHGRPADPADTVAQAERQVIERSAKVASRAKPTPAIMALQLSRPAVPWRRTIHPRVSPAETRRIPLFRPISGHRFPSERAIRMNVIIGVLITFLVIILVLYLVNMLPIDGRAKQIVQIIVIIIGVISLLKYLAVF